MRHAFIALAVFAAMAPGAGASVTTAWTCADGGTTTRTGGGYRIDYCGSAVASLRIGDKTYVFRNGSCFDVNGKGVFMFSGTEIIHDGELANVVGGSPGPFIWIATTKQGATLVAYDGPHPLVAGDPNVIKTGSIGPVGRFAGRSKALSKPISAKATVAFSGTWSCNGTVHSWDDYIGNVNRPEGG